MRSAPTRARHTRRGGGAKNTTAESVRGTCARSSVSPASTYNSQPGSHPPVWGPFSITNSGCTSAPKVFDVSGLSNAHVKGFTVTNCAFKGVGSTSNTFSNVDNRVFTNVTINGKKVT